MNLDLQAMLRLLEDLRLLSKLKTKTKKKVI